MGFKEEGRLRENVFFDNQFHDTVVLGLLKSEFEKSRR
jgi:RimJ/RimL family protein N-acetyltransferase